MIATATELCQSDRMRYCFLSISTYPESMKRRSFSEQIRDAVRRSGRNNNDLSNAMNTVPTVLHRFMKNGRGVTTTVLDRLAEVLDLHVVVGSKRKGGGK